MEARTFTLNCKGVVGDMLYLIDLDYNASGGHNIVEVEIYGRGEANNLYKKVYLMSKIIVQCA
jgi:hypothetical protein